MPLFIVKNDITKMKVDAIVNAANETLLGGGGVDGCIHRAAGKALYEECKTLGGCKVSEAKITGAYKLPCKKIIHTVGPIWRGGIYGEKELLYACYRNSLLLAHEHGIESIAFPLISAGAYGYPAEAALRVALGAINDFLADCDMTVYMVIYRNFVYSQNPEYLKELNRIIGERKNRDAEICSASFNSISGRACKKSLRADREEACEEACVPDGLDERLNHIDESFSQMLLRKIDESGMSDSECYKRANIDRKLFSKIRSDANYRPSKPTVIAFAIALRLSLKETNELLMKAGFALSRSKPFDIIVEYFIEKQIFDIAVINETLFAFDQALLGA